MKSSAVNAIVLAAGQSTRIRSAIGNIPKPLLRIHGISLLAHNLKLLSRHGIKNVWINLHYHPEMIRAEIGNGRKWGVSVSYSFEKVLLGTAGAIKKLSKSLSKETFLVLYGDNYTNCNLSRLLETHVETSSIATITVFNPEKSLNSGIAGGWVKIGKRGDVTGFVERRSNQNRSSVPGKCYVNSGIYALDPSVFKYIPTGYTDFGKDIFPKLVKRSVPVYSYILDGFCLAVDSPEAYKTTREIIRRKRL